MSDLQHTNLLFMCTTLSSFVFLEHCYLQHIFKVIPQGRTFCLLDLLFNQGSLLSCISWTWHLFATVSRFKKVTQQKTFTVFTSLNSSVSNQIRWQQLELLDVYPRLCKTSEEFRLCLKCVFEYPLTSFNTNVF